MAKSAYTTNPSAPDYHQLNPSDPFYQTPDYKKGVSKFRKYGLTVREHDQILFAQDFRCAGCAAHLSADTMKIDHCHDTGNVRGLLCHPCNITLGWAKDNPKTLDRLARYIVASRKGRAANR